MNTLLAIMGFAALVLVFVLIGVAAKCQEHLDKIAADLYIERQAITITRQLVLEINEAIARIEPPLRAELNARKARRPAEYGD